MRKPIEPPFELPTLEEIDQMGEGEDEREEPNCEVCDGEGVVDGKTCQDCEGTGKEKPFDMTFI